MATITSNKKKYGQPIITAATGSTETKKQPIITAAQSSANTVNKLNHTQEYNLDGTKKVPLTVTMTKNNIIDAGAKNKVSNALKNDIHEMAKQAALKSSYKDSFEENLGGVKEVSLLAETGKGLGKSILNTGIETGKGVIDFSEGILDTGLQLGSSKYNPGMWIKTGQTPWSKDQSKLDEYQNIAKEIIQKDASQKFIDEQLGYEKKLSNGKTIQETLNEGSLIKSDNLGGKIFRNMGAQLPGLMTGNEAQSLTLMGINSFGAGTEEAYNNGATRGQATGYGLLNSTIEVATEKMFAGVGGLYGNNELDDIVIDKINKNIKSELAQKLTSLGVKSLGEGTEELVGDLLQPLAQKLTYASEEDLIKLYSDQDYLEDFVTGALSSAIMQGSTMPVNNANQQAIKDSLKGKVNTQNAIEIYEQIKAENDGLADWEVANIVNNALQETNQKAIDFSKTKTNANLTAKSNIEQQIVSDNTSDNIEQNPSKKLSKKEIKAIAEEVNTQQEKKLTQTVEMPKEKRTNVIENSKSFSEQVDDVLNNKYPKRDMLVVSKNTPKVLQDIGLSDLPITMTQKHLYTMTHESGKYSDANYHNIDIETIKQIPEALSKPLNVLKSDTKDDSIVVVTELSDKNDDIIVASIKIDGKGQISDIQIDTNVMTSAYGKSKNYDYFMQDNINRGNLLYDIDEGIIKRISSSTNSSSKLDATDRLQLSMRSSNERNSVSDIPKNASPISNNNDTTKAKKSQVAPISSQYSMQQNEKNDTKKVNAPISEELKKKVIRDKVKTKKNNNGLKSARTAAKIAKNKMDLSNNEKNEFRKELMKYKGYTKEKLTNAKTYNEIKDIVKKYSDREISYINREIQDVKDYIKNTKLEVTQELKNSITDYNDFRKSNFGKLKLSNEGMSIDSFYEELSQTYPGYFSNEIDTDEDRLYAIADFMNEDSTITEKYSLDDKTIDDITAKVFNTLQNNAFSEEQIEEFKKEISDRMSKITRKSVREMLQKQMGITAEDLSIGKDIKSPNYQITDPIRVNEKVFGRELGDKINNETIRKTTHNEARKVRWLNSERNDIKELGIKPRSKESAAVQKYGEKQYLNNNGELVKYGDKELRAEFPNEKTQEKIKRAAEVIRNKYDKYIDQINETLTSLGYDAIPKRADYMRHFQELGDIFSKTGVPFNLNDMRAEDLPTDINGLTEFNRPGKNYFASAQKRIGQKTTYDAITGIDGYLEGAGNLIFHTADIQRYRALSSLIRDSFGSSKGFNNLGNLTDAQAEQRVNDILDNKLSRYAAWLDEQANNLAGKKGAIDRGVERFLGRKVYTGLNTIKKQVGSNMTGFNVRSALTNLISSTIASAKTNKLAFVKGTASTISNMFKNDGFIEKSDFLTNRIIGSEQLSKKFWQKASNAGQIFMTGTDYFTANQITRSKYYEGLQKGMSESEAIKYADDFASRVMGDRSLGRTAEAFNSKTLGLLTQFQLEVNNQWQYMIHDTVMDYQKNSQINGGLKAGATALFQMGQLAAFSYFFNEVFEALTGSRAAFDPVEILKKLFGSDDEDRPWDERISAANKELFDNIPFGNLFTGGGRIPISEAFKGTGTFAKKMTGQKNQYGGDITWEDVGTDVLGSLPYYLLPTGYSQAKKTTKGLSMFSKDKEIKGSYTKSGRLRFPVKDTALNKIQAGLFGEYSSSEAKKYFEQNRSALTKNQQNMYKALKMPISDYWEINKEINSIKKELTGKDMPTSERKEKYFDYIDSLDISGIKKSILKKSLYKSYTSDDYEIRKYINSSNMSKQSKKDILEKLGLY